MWEPSDIRIGHEDDFVVASLFNVSGLPRHHYPPIPGAKQPL